MDFFGMLDLMHPCTYYHSFITQLLSLLISIISLLTSIITSSLVRRTGRQNRTAKARDFQVKPASPQFSKPVETPFSFTSFSLHSQPNHSKLSQHTLCTSYYIFIYS